MNKNLIVVGVCLAVAGACIYTIRKYGMKDGKCASCAKNTASKDVPGADAGQPTASEAKLLSLQDLKVR